MPAIKYRVTLTDDEVEMLEAHAAQGQVRSAQANSGQDTAEGGCRLLRMRRLSKPWPCPPP